MSRKQLDAYSRHKAEKSPARRSRIPKRKTFDQREFDRQATDLPRGVFPAPATVDCPSGDGTKLRVVRNLRGDTLAYLRDRNQIDEHQFHAGRRWQEIYEAACGTVPAMDTTKEPVDGGGVVSDGLTEKRKRATKALLSADLALQPEGAYLMRHIAGSGITLAQASEVRGVSAKTLGKKFRVCLDVLAVEFGLADHKLLTLPVKQV